MKKPPTLDLSKVDGFYQSVDATGFEPATSASRTQRSTKLSHATIINMNCVNIKIINKNPLIVKQKTNMIEEKVAKTIKSRN